MDKASDHLHPSSIEVKNAWSYTSALPYSITAWSLIKLRDNFTSTLAGNVPKFKSKTEVKMPYCFKRSSII
jgi:hypothetical protein